MYIWGWMHMSYIHSNNCRFQNDDYQWQLFLTEVLLVMLFGIIGMTNTIVQYRICVRLQNGIISTDDVSGSIL